MENDCANKSLFSKADFSTWRLPRPQATYKVTNAAIAYSRLSTKQTDGIQSSAAPSWSPEL